ncbi:hypothetical protein JCM5350_005102 [Sporobolomyces pararoseus]
MSQDTQRDFLSSLPPELLSEIFNYAYKDSEPPRAPISRAFLPFQRQALFRQVRIDSLSHFEQLVEAYELNAGLGRMVRTLEVNNVDRQEGGGGGTKNERRMKGFFSSLVNLEQLKLGLKTTSLIDLVLSLRIARSDRPQLRSLVLEIPLNWKKPFESKIYRYLNEYPSLRRLEISTEKHDRFACNSRGGGKLTKITELVLKGPAVDNSKTLSFLQNFPSLTSLTLDTLTSDMPNYSSLVAVLPTSLTSLTLLSRGFYDGYLRPCDQHFPRLVNLESLYLSEGAFTQEVFDSLRQLPKLATLEFGKGAILSCSRLEELILGPNRIPTLEKVIFDQVEGKVGWSIFGDSDGITLHPDHEAQSFHLGPGWVPPRWSPEQNFKDDDIKSLVSRIKEAGIIVDGKTVEAIGIDKAFDLEAMACMVAHGNSIGNFDECRAVFGDGFVDELVGLDEEYGCECGECW